MWGNTKVFFFLFLIIIFDSLFINYDLGLFNITLMRIGLFIISIIIGINLLKKGKLSFNKPIKFIVIFSYLWFFQLFLSLFWAIDKGPIIKGIYYYFIYILMIIVIVYLVKRGSENNIFNSIQLVAFFMAFLGLLEYLGYIRFNVSRYVQEEYIDLLTRFNLTKVTGPFLNENDYSLFLALLFPFLLVGIFKSTNMRKIFSFLSIGIYLFIIYKNNAQLVLLMIGIEIIVFFILVEWKSYKKVVKNSFVLLVAIGTIIFVVLLVTDPRLASGTTSINIRWNLLLNSWFALKETNFIGGGISSFKYYMDDKLYYGGIINPHNWWVELLVEHGIFIAVLYIGIFIFIIILLIKLYKKLKLNNLLVLPLIMCLIALFVGSLAPSSFYYFWPNWFIVGLSIAVINNYREGEEN